MEVGLRGFRAKVRNVSPRVAALIVWALVAAIAAATLYLEHMLHGSARITLWVVMALVIAASAIGTWLSSGK